MFFGHSNIPIIMPIIIRKFDDSCHICVNVPLTLILICTKDIGTKNFKIKKENKEIFEKFQIFDE